MYIGTRKIAATLVAMNLMIMTIPAIYAVGMIIGDNSQSLIASNSLFTYGVSLQHSLTLVCALMSVFVGMLVSERLDEEQIVIFEPTAKRRPIVRSNEPLVAFTYHDSRPRQVDRYREAYMPKSQKDISPLPAAATRTNTKPADRQALRTPTAPAPHQVAVPANNRSKEVAIHPARATVTICPEPRRETMVPPTPAPLSVRSYGPPMVPPPDTTYAGQLPFALG